MFSFPGETNYSLTLSAALFDPLLDLDNTTEAQVGTLGGQLSAI
jgi:hypothetical protein